MNKSKFYRCPICGNIVYLTNKDNAIMMCCGEKMVCLEANTTDAALEKHVPEVKVVDNKLVVTIGEVIHPMTEEHYITFIALEKDNKINIVKLTPNDEPTVEFPYEENATVYEYCNLHGLWKKDI